MFIVDSTTWEYPCDISRAAEVRASDVSGMMLDGSYYNDVLGTFMEYTVKIAVPLNRRDQYSALYELLTDPVEGHTFVLPYNQGTVEITGRVENVSDVYVRLPNGALTWRGIQFTVLANSPTKALTNAQVYQRGRLMLPEMAAHNEGDTWVWSEGKWELSVSYRNADEIYY